MSAIPPRPSRAKSSRSAPAVRALAKRHVVVVDPNAEAWAKIAGLLRRLGATITTVSSVEEIAGVLRCGTPDVVVARFAAGQTGAFELLERVGSLVGGQGELLVVALAPAVQNDLRQVLAADHQPSVSGIDGPEHSLPAAMAECLNDPHAEFRVRPVGLGPSSAPSSPPGGALLKPLSRVVAVEPVEASHGTACARQHVLSEKLVSWLCSAADVAGDELLVTHELIATCLGVRRPGVTICLGNLQRRGLLASRRGRIRILDRARLESLACECYDAVREESEVLRDTIL